MTDTRNQAPATAGEQRMAELERGFRRDGLPLFIEDRRAATDVFNRAAPLLALVLLIEVLSAIQLEWSLAGNVAAAIGGLLVLLAAAAVVNRVRGRRPLAVPQRLGREELAAFVLLPALVPLVIGAQLGTAIAVVAINLSILAAIYAVLGLGLAAIVSWVMRRLAGQVRSALPLIAKALPLLAIFALLSFTTVELWRIYSSMDRAIYSLTVGLFVGLGSMFLLVRIPREARLVESEAGERQPPLSRRQLANVGLVMFVSQATQVALVSLAIGAFFTLFGLLAVDAETRVMWMGTEGNVLLSLGLFGQQLELTSQLLRVAGGLAAFSGFYFAIAILTDSTYREEFLSELTDEMRSSFRERAEYLRLRESAADAADR